MLKIKRRHSRIFILILILVIISSYGMQAEETTKRAGTFSNMKYDENTGDVSGYEVVIKYSDSKYSGTYRYAVGEPRPFAPIKPIINGEMISFTFEYPRKRGKPYKGQFIGFYYEKGISGTISDNKSRTTYKVNLIRQPSKGTWPESVK